MGVKSTFTTGRLTLNWSRSPSFHRFLVAYRMTCTDHEKFLLQDFASARNLVNMLSKLENSEMLRKESF